MTHDEWVAAALDAAVDQLGQVAIEDPKVLDLIARTLNSATPPKRPVKS
jgi:hypothetical protein